MLDRIASFVGGLLMTLAMVMGVILGTFIARTLHDLVLYCWNSSPVVGIGIFIVFLGIYAEYQVRYGDKKN